jgi:hypothetical protein
MTFRCCSSRWLFWTQQLKFSTAESQGSSGEMWTWKRLRRGPALSASKAGTCRQHFGPPFAVSKQDRIQIAGSARTICQASRADFAVSCTLPFPYRANPCNPADLGTHRRSASALAITRKLTGISATFPSLGSVRSDCGSCSVTYARNLPIQSSGRPHETCAWRAFNARLATGATERPAIQAHRPPIGCP